MFVDIVHAWLNDHHQKRKTEPSLLQFSNVNDAKHLFHPDQFKFYTGVTRLLQIGQGSLPDDGETTFIPGFLWQKIEINDRENTHVIDNF